jgi:hypothetical protein
MTLYSDDINRGYEILKEHLVKLGLYDRVQNKQAIDPLIEDQIFSNDHYGGIQFDYNLQNITGIFRMVYTRRDLFEIIVMVNGNIQILRDFPYDDLVNLIHSLTLQKVKEEDKLLQNVVDINEYRKVAKKMHYIDLDEDTEF